MRDVESLLQQAGERWRDAQPSPPAVDPRTLTAAPRQRVPADPAGPGVMGLAAVGLAAALVLGLAAMGFRLDRGVGGPPGGASAPVASQSSSSAGCPVTRPEPPFVPPPPSLAVPPALYESAWFGSRELWTMIDRDGEVWAESGLPRGPNGLTQKTFWWSADWSPDAEPEPAITVTGARLDGTGTLESSGGTNASADFGTAMLVGVEFPTAGCWQLTGRYRNATLSYVVSIIDD